MSHHVLVFDSGVGGLSVVAEIRKRRPDLFLSYVADDEFRPYGDKSEAALQARLPGLLKTLCLMLEPVAVVIACNTASTTALQPIRDALPIPVIGVVPAIKPAAETSRMRTIGVLGTPGTIRRRYVNDLISDFASDCEVVLQGSTRLVEQAERKLSGKSVDLDIIRDEIAPLFQGKRGMDVDAVVLACTHFPLLKAELKQAVRQTVSWVDSGEAIARRLNVVLSEHISKQKPDYPETAFLIGPKTDQARAQAFNSYGFSKTIGLLKN